MFVWIWWSGFSDGREQTRPQNPTTAFWIPGRVALGPGIAMIKVVWTLAEVAPPTGGGAESCLEVHDVHVNDPEMFLAISTPHQVSHLQGLRERLRAAWFFNPDGMRLGKRRNRGRLPAAWSMYPSLRRSACCCNQGLRFIGSPSRLDAGRAVDISGSKT